MKKHATKNWPLWGVVALLVVGTGSVYLFRSNDVDAAATNVIGLQLRDATCNGGEGTIRYASDVGQWTSWAGDSDNYDPDCIRIHLGNTIPKDVDIRIGIQARDINTPCGFLWLFKCGDGGGTVRYSNWVASSTGSYFNQWTSWAGDADMWDGDQWRFIIETRPNYGYQVSDFKYGIQTGDMSSWSGGCTDQSSPVQYTGSSTAPASWSAWAVDTYDGANPNCVRINLIATSTMNAPEADLTGTSTVASGNSVNIPWTVNYIHPTTGCTLTGRDGGGVIVDPSYAINANGNGSKTSIAITEPITYTLFCNGNKPGTTVQDTITISPFAGTPPTISFSMNPTTGLSPGGISVATIAVTNGEMCTLTGYDLGYNIVDEGYTFEPPPPSAAGADGEAFITDTNLGSWTVPSNWPTTAGTAVQTFTATPAGGTWTPPAGVTSVEVLIVAGGGGGGSAVDRTGGGGGGGGVIYNASYAVTPGTPVTVTVGNGGAANTAGQNSVFGTLTAVGGGRGGQISSTATTGGSGGGAYHSAGDSGKAGTAGQGNAGGNGSDNPNPTFIFTGGGGGGAGGAGANGTASAGGNGGAGYISSISGASVTYGCGGGGGTQRSGSTPIPAGSGGSSGACGGGGGAATTNSGANGTAGTANRGGGGGGAGEAYTSGTNNVGGAGGSGVVIVKYTTTGSAVYTIEVIGAGGGGGNDSGAGGRGGGGGGAYSKVTNVFLVPGNSYGIQVGAGGGARADGEDTYFGGSGTVCAVGQTVCAKGGGGGGPQYDGGPGGNDASGIGTTKFDGGNGGTLSLEGWGGAGGGGAAGPNGAGRTGGRPSSSGSQGGGGGGGAGGGSSTSGGNSGSSGGAGGLNYLGTTGGGSGGRGGNCCGSGTGPLNGTNGIEWGSYGAGGGGGAGVDNTSNSNPGDGGLYGGGGGGAGDDSNSAIGNGARGIIRVSYTGGTADNTEAQTSEHVINQTTNFVVMCTPFGGGNPVYATSTVTLADCRLDGVSIPNGSPGINFFSATTPPAGQMCSDIDGLRGCTNGQLTGLTQYQYRSCTDASDVYLRVNGATNTSVRKGATVAVSWDGGTAESCIVTGTNGFTGADIDGLTPIAATTTSVINQKTVFTARCTLGSIIRQASATVNILPTVIEI